MGVPLKVGLAKVSSIFLGESFGVSRRFFHVEMESDGVRSIFVACKHSHIGGGVRITVWPLDTPIVLLQV